MRVVLDPGHGGYDPGAIGPVGLKEKDVTLAVALKVARELRRAGVEVILTRESDSVPWPANVTQDLAARCEIANNAGAAPFVSIHCNSASDPSACGTETYCYKPSGESEALARAVQEELVAAVGRPNRGIKTANYYVLRRTNMPAVLTELAFISNPQEEQLLASDAIRETCAVAIARGIGKIIGVQIVREVLSMFKDVPVNHWAAGSIERLAKLGIIKGDEQGNFRPDQPITRAEVVALLDRLLKLLGR
ncbi:MAG: N-acetylmuramoyl-L-alanine amidase [Desulfofundulus sp.]